MQKYHQMKANFIYIYDIFYQREKKLQRTWFFHLFGVLSCKHRAKIAQGSGVFASKLKDTSLAAIIFTLI